MDRINIQLSETCSIKECDPENIHENVPDKNILNNQFELKLSLTENIVQPLEVKATANDIINKDVSPVDICQQQIERLTLHELTENPPSNASTVIANSNSDFESSQSSGSSTLIHPLRKTNETLRYGCKLCYKTYDLLKSLKAHIRRHGGEKLYKCSVCKKCFLRSDMLQKKYLVVKGAYYQCHICNIHCPTESMLKTHLRSHIRVEPFVCYLCDARFEFYGLLYRHKLTHVGVRHLCQECRTGWK